jgi:hypothetical protein
MNLGWGFGRVSLAWARFANWIQLQLALQTYADFQVRIRRAKSLDRILGYCSCACCITRYDGLHWNSSLDQVACNSTCHFNNCVFSHMGIPNLFPSGILLAFYSMVL